MINELVELLRKNRNKHVLNHKSGKERKQQELNKNNAFLCCSKIMN